MITTTIREVPHVAGSEVLSVADLRALIEVADYLGTAPGHLLAVIGFETGRTYSPRVRNKTTGATGLIQFMPQYAPKVLGLTTDQLAAMTFVQQLQQVKRWLAPHRGKLQTPRDLYLAVLAPKYVGAPAETPIYSKPAAAYTQNAGLDANRDGVITADEAALHVYALLRDAAGRTPYRVEAAPKAGGFPLAPDPGATGGQGAAPVSAPALTDTERHPVGEMVSEGLDAAAPLVASSPWYVRALVAVGRIAAKLLPW